MVLSPEVYLGAEGCALGVAQFVRDRGCVQFREIDDILTEAGIPVDDGDEELTGKHIHRDNVVHESTALRGPVSYTYCEVIERLFTAYPVALQIGDPASFPSGHEPWHVVWYAYENNGAGRHPKTPTMPSQGEVTHSTPGLMERVQRIAANAHAATSAPDSRSTQT